MNIIKKTIFIFTLLLTLIGTSSYIAAVEIDNSATLPSLEAFKIHNPATFDAEAMAEVDIDELTDDSESIDETARRLGDYAASFLGTRYVWGATGPKSFDCSGFIGYVFRNEGIHLPRTSAMQFRQGERVKGNDWQVGDLLFFSSRRSGKGRVGHVAMVTEVNPDGSCTFIHASTKRGVVYQKFPDGGYYSRNYVGARRILDSADDIS